MTKKGHNYVANVVVSFDTLKQAENFCREGTAMGRVVKEDLKGEDLDALDTLFDGDGVECEVTFEDGFTEEVQKELDAAVSCGADITLECGWVPND